MPQPTRIVADLLKDSKWNKKEQVANLKKKHFLEVYSKSFFQYSNAPNAKNPVPKSTRKTAKKYSLKRFKRIQSQQTHGA